MGATIHHLYEDHHWDVDHSVILAVSTVTRHSKFVKYSAEGPRRITYWLNDPDRKTGAVRKSKYVYGA